MAEKIFWKEDELTCKPLDTYDEILSFIQNPPSWRTLCTEIKPHSENIIRNVDINKGFGATLLESPQTFCHYNPEAEEVKRHERKTMPKTLVCHDMANGYHDDCFIDGTGKSDAYTFYNWAAVDVFCYFSHHLLTIPPLAWINTGHAHGTKVIGTIITEWKDGFAFWEKMLESEEKWRNFASALVAIAKTLKFDGWLLNIENKISKPDALAQFVKHLHTILHQELTEPELIWYDSVTVDGHLQWQNGLNEKNRKFFDLVDGFFTNYSWSEADVARSARAAGDRRHDLYIGMDVWGRNFRGGGKFNTKEAVQIAHKYDCSMAIFAPAWTHEALSNDKLIGSEQLTTYEQFLLRDRALWGSLWPFLNTKLPSALPFQTSFCRGQGIKRRLYGEVISPLPWYNLRRMQYQPNSSHGPHGYVLSTQGHITHINQIGILKDNDMIHNYRRSIEETKTVLEADDLPPLNNDEMEPPDSVNEVEIDKSEDFIDGETKSSKRKLSEVNDGSKAKTSKTELTQDTSKTEDNKDDLGTEENINSTEVTTIDKNTPATSKTMLNSVMVNLLMNKPAAEKTAKATYTLAYVPKELQCLEPYLLDSFLGGSCLKVNPRDEVSKDHRLSRMFHCDFYCKSKLIACVVTKNLTGNENQFLNVILTIQRNGRSSKVVLIGHKPVGNESSRPDQVFPVDTRGNEFRELQKYVLLNESSFYVPVQNAYGWNVRYYLVEVPGGRVSSVSCRTGAPEGPVLLGHFGLCHKDN